MQKFLSGILCLFLSVSLHSQTALDSLWNDPDVEQRIRKGIENNRMADFSIQFPQYKGTTEIEIHQLDNEFFFGANGFMVQGFDTKEKNLEYEKIFASVFNLATVPFYWKTLEPQPGKLRFDSTSEPIYRRPPPDVVLGFCRKYNITPKGHTLVWNNPTHSVPDWLSKDTLQIQAAIKNRIDIIAKHYGNSAIQTWDVVNESLHHFPQVIMPEDYVYSSFVEAAKVFPASTKLMINEVTSVWQGNVHEYSPYNMLIRNLFLRGAKIDAIGLQFHFFNEQLHYDVLAGKAMQPKQMFAVLDLYGRYNKPLHISEITIPSLPNNATGQQNQAKLTRNFYRLWFSHPAVEAIIWWNVVDGTAVKGEDKWNGGFVNNDFSPKPAYDELKKLINVEWKTNIKAKLNTGDNFSFKGFFGSYEVTVKQGKKITKQKIIFNKDGKHSATIL
ncbi:endo-1,4-beta-xylanase [Pollutibacter soli]|uniref:endo-1,4-beta-xylanase n=1 Tax=Pollutibacter soli TaxID=3034157 RepID=UPI003013F0B5